MVRKNIRRAKIWVHFGELDERIVRETAVGLVIAYALTA